MIHTRRGITSVGHLQYEKIVRSPQTILFLLKCTLIKVWLVVHFFLVITDNDHVSVFWANLIFCFSGCCQRCRWLDSLHGMGGAHIFSGHRIYQNSCWGQCSSLLSSQCYFLRCVRYLIFIYNHIIYIYILILSMFFFLALWRSRNMFQFSTVALGPRFRITWSTWRGGVWTAATRGWWFNVDCHVFSEHSGFFYMIFKYYSCSQESLQGLSVSSLNIIES